MKVSQGKGNTFKKPVGNSDWKPEKNPKGNLMTITPLEIEKISL